MSTLDMFEQLELERRCLLIFAMPQVQAQIIKAEQLFLTSVLAQRPDGKERASLAAERFARAAVETAVLNDPARPKIMWVIDEGREWFGVNYPAAAWGGKNPDNFSRDTVIDDVSQFEITGLRAATGPAQMTIMLYEGFIGTQGQSVEGAPVIATLVDRRIKIRQDGSYTITVGPEAGMPDGNHLQTRPGAKFIHIRNAFSDWETQTPDQLRIRRVAGPDAEPERSDEEIAEAAIGLIALQVPYWLRFFEEQAISRGEPNKMGMFVARQGGWGYISSGTFRLEDDEALVISIDALSAEYLSIQTSDLWSIPGNYIRANVSLNKTQACPNSDGTYTFVVACSDPGVWNWVDTAGLHDGSFTLRWQGIPAGEEVTQGRAIRAIRQVKLADLASNLREDTKWVSVDERQRQLENREASFARRLDLTKANLTWIG